MNNDQKEKNLIVKKCQCKHCKKNLITKAGIHFKLQLPDKRNVYAYLSGTVGNYTVNVANNINNVKIPKGAKLIIKCPECGESLHINETSCQLVGVEFKDDPYPDYTIEFLSEKGKHGTIVKKDGVEIYHDGEHYSAVAFGEKHPMNKEDQKLIRTTSMG